MSTPVERITNSGAIVSVFGHWPSFHDAEVLGLEIARRFNEPPGPSLVVQIHVFSMTNEVDDRGYFVCKNHSTVALKFGGIDELELDGFNHQNALSGLVIASSGSEGLFDVHFDPAYGMESRFKCRTIEVLSVIPGIPPASVYARAKA
jgi:hypothetical protein